MKRKLDLSVPEFGFVVGTRAALGVGIGLLVAERLRRRPRRRLGAALLGLGALTTIPAAWLLRARIRPSQPAPARLAPSA